MALMGRCNGAVYPVRSLTVCFGRVAKAFGPCHTTHGKAWQSDPSHWVNVGEKAVIRCQFDP